MKVLITGINYAPEDTGNAPYTTGLAEYLAAAGADVTVLTGMPYYPEWRVADRYGGRFRSVEERNGVTVKRLRTYVPRRQDAIRRLGFEAGFMVNGALPNGLVRPDAIVGVVPSLSGAGLAALYSRRFRVPYGLIFQDLVGAAARQSGIRGGQRVARITQNLEGRAARGASRIAVISPGFMNYLESLSVPMERVVHIRNWSHLASPTMSREHVRGRLGWPESAVVVLHAGAMGLKQGLANVVDAARLAMTTHPEISFVFMGDGNQKASLADRALGLPNVVFVPPCAKDDLPDILAAADVLLINERASVADMSLPSKLTSYLVAGRPIVAAVPTTGYTAREVRQTGAGVVVPAEQPGQLVDAIADLAGDAARAGLLGRSGSRYAAETLGADSILPLLRDFVECIARSGSR